MRHPIALGVAVCIATTTLLVGCGSPPEAPKTDGPATSQAQAREAIQNEFTALAGQLPKPAYLSRLDPHGAQSTDGTFGCGKDPLRVVFMAVYWVKGITAAEETKYRSLIEGVWGNRHGWTTTQQDPGLAFTSPGGYGFVASGSAPGLSITGESGCFPNSGVDGMHMPDTLGDITR